MSTPKFYTPAGSVVTRIEEWPCPKHEKHWKEEYSAIEEARSWFALRCPDELTALFESHPRTAGFIVEEGYPEHVTPLPVRGEGRNHDLALVGRTSHEKIVVCVEAKVDEPFGDKGDKGTVGGYGPSAIAQNDKSGVPARIRELLNIAFGPAVEYDKQPWAGLRYQLLTAFVGTLLETDKRGISTAIFAVHELRKFSKFPDNLAANQIAFQQFVDVIFPGEQVQVGRLLGPLLVPARGALKHPVEIFIGKAVHC